MFKKIALIFVVLMAILLGFAATKPDTFRIQRETSIKAPPAKLFELLSDMHNNSSWSPFETDPTLKKTFSGPTSGKGSTYEWTGKEAGVGRMEIIESTPPSKIKFTLDFIQPFQAHNIAEFTMEPQGDTTKVTWAMYGPQPYVGKVMSLFLNCDRMVGKEFETGLSNMKALAEK